VTRVARFLDLPPAVVWSVLADATTYADWVVGCRYVRYVEGPWPAVGSAFHHSFGAGPAYVDDKTIVLSCEPERRLVLEARAAPFGSATVSFYVDRAADGTHLVMDEQPLRPIALRLAAPALAAPTIARNTLSLRRLHDLARRRSAVL
jgi:uncharacterized protein YndB with AHSA1/START domain